MLSVKGYLAMPRNSHANNVTVIQIEGDYGSYEVRSSSSRGDSARTFTTLSNNTGRPAVKSSESRQSSLMHGLGEIQLSAPARFLNSALIFLCNVVRFMLEACQRKCPP